MQTTTPVAATGQIVYVHQPIAPPLNQSSGAGKSERFNVAAGRATGWVQLSCGIASIIVAVAQIVLGAVGGYSRYGIWASLLFYIPAGILGICTVRKNTCLIIGYLTMSIIAAIFAGGQILEGSIGGTRSSFCSYHRGCESGFREGRIASDVLLAILGLVEMITAIVGSAYCCGGMSCGTSSTIQQTTVVTHGAPRIVTAGVASQPATDQPPPYNVQHAYPPAAQFGGQTNHGLVA